MNSPSPFKTPTTKEKALRINLDRRIYGSFAEIGAGQEVANNFFRSGGASGTIAMTISAYDMKISDSIYGECERYVCEPRLMTMLNKEYALLQERLTSRSDESFFFTFANTVEVLNYFKTNAGQGWMGIRFQLGHNQPYNECVIHVVLHDNEGIAQQEAIGILGVNLIYGCFYHYRDPEYLMNSLQNDLSPGRVEIDMFRLTGPDFEEVDNRLMSLQLVKNGHTEAALFGHDGKVLQASEALYKRNILVLRGRFRPVTHVNLDMLEKGLKMFEAEEDVNQDRIKVIFELTLKDLRSDGEISEKDFLDRVDILCSLGHTVMISNYQKYYTLVSYLSNSTRGRKVGVILGIYNLSQIFEDKYYDRLKGRLLESIGLLFGRNVKLFVYPAIGHENNGLFTTSELDFEDKNLLHLFNYLKASNKIEDIENAKREVLNIFSDDVLELIQAGKPGWEQQVPELVVEAIKKHKLFDYPGLPEAAKA